MHAVLRKSNDEYFICQTNRNNKVSNFGPISYRGRLRFNELNSSVRRGCVIPRPQIPPINKTVKVKVSRTVELWQRAECSLMKMLAK